MKKKTIVILIVITLIFASFAGVVWWQFENIKAVYFSFKYSDEDLDRQISKANDNVKDYLSSNPQYSVRPSEPVEEQLHQEGMITDTEFADIITGESSVVEVFGKEIELNDDKKLTISETGEILDNAMADKLKEEAKSGKDSDSSNESETPKNGSVDNSAEISQCVAQMYVLKSNFVSRLDGLYNQAVSYYYSLTPEQQKSDGKTLVINKFYSSAASMEAECDGQVSANLAKLTTLLKEQGSGTELVDKIKAAYYEEKSLKKAYYINKLK